MERRRNEAGVWQLSWLQIAAVLMVAAGLVVTPIVVMMTRSTETRSSEAPSSVATSPASGGGASGVASGVEPATSVAVDAVASEPTGRVVAASATTLAEDGIVVDVVDPGPGTPAGPTMNGAPELTGLLSYQSNVMLRVRWSPAAGVVTGYHVACDQIADSPAELAETVDVVKGGASLLGVNTFRAHLETTTTETQVFFNNPNPIPGAEYRCTVTPNGPAGAGESRSATVRTLPDNFAAILGLMGPSAIQSVTQVGPMLTVTVTTGDGGAPAGSPIVFVRCTPVGGGTPLFGVANPQSDEGFTGPAVAFVGGIVVGAQYDCVALPIGRGLSAPVRSDAVVNQSGGLPPAPASIGTGTTYYGNLTLYAVAPAGLTPGSTLGTRAQCALAGSSVTRTLVGGGTVESSEAGQWFWAAGGGLNMPGGTWTCAVAFVTELGEGPTVSVTVTVSPAPPRPTGLTFLGMDGANGMFSVDVGDPASWLDPTIPEQTPGLIALCVNVATDARLDPQFLAPLSALPSLGGTTKRISVPLDPGTPYRCEFALLAAFPDGSFSPGVIAVHEFVTPVGAGLASLGVAPLVEAPVVSADEPAEVPAEVATIDPGVDAGAVSVGGDADAPGDAPEASPTPTDGDDEGGDAGASDPATLPTEPDIPAGDV